MKRLLLFVVLPIILCSSLAAQNNIHYISAATRLKNKEKLTRTERYLSTLDPDTPIEGSMYLEDEFAPAVVIYQNGNIENQYFLDTMPFTTKWNLSTQKAIRWCSKTLRIFVGSS